MLQKFPAALGAALRGRRPGPEALVSQREFGWVPDLIAVTSPAFTEGAPMPPAHTADGDGLSPALFWDSAPEGTRSIALLLEDADSPTPRPLVHLIAWNLPPCGALVEGELNQDDSEIEPGIGRNSYLKTEFLPPDPLPGHGPHRYVFQFFALDCPLAFEKAPGRAQLIAAMRGHVLGRGSLTGTYERARRS